MRNRHSAILIALMFIGLASSVLAPCRADTLEIGSPAPDFSFPAWTARPTAWTRSAMPRSWS